jgi:hypothetical protein
MPIRFWRSGAVVGATRSFGEITLLPDAGTWASGLRTPRGRILLGGYVDPNPERIIVDDEILRDITPAPRPAKAMPDMNVGDSLTSAVLAPLDYSFLELQDPGDRDALVHLGRARSRDDVGPHREGGVVALVLAFELALLLVGELAEGVACTGAARLLVRHDERAAQREVGANAGDRLEHRVLGVIEALGEGAHYARGQPRLPRRARSVPAGGRSQPVGSGRRTCTDPLPRVRSRRDVWLPSSPPPPRSRRRQRG